MAKISRPILYAAVLGAAAYAVLLLTEPDAPKKKPTLPARNAAAEAPKGFSKEDLNAHFARYSGGKNDAFRPRAVSRRSKVVAAKAADAVKPSPDLPPMAGVWSLTGITVVNGIPSALMENATADQVVFLKAGEMWNNLRVTAIEPDAVILANTQGKITRIGFPVVVEEKEKSGATTPLRTPPLAPTLQPVPQVPPMPVPAVPGLTPGTGVRF